MNRKTGATKPEWDTPADGDFARYVERLTAAVPARAAPMAPRGTAAAAPRKPAAAGGTAAASAAPAQALPPDLAQLLAPLAGGLRIVRFVLLLVMALHGIALFLFGQGSLPGLVAMAAIWWGLSWLIASAPAAASARGSATAFGADALQERLRQVAQQRKTGKKKQP